MLMKNNNPAVCTEENVFKREANSAEKPAFCWWWRVTSTSSLFSVRVISFLYILILPNLYLNSSSRIKWIFQEVALHLQCSLAFSLICRCCTVCDFALIFYMIWMYWGYVNCVLFFYNSYICHRAASWTSCKQICILSGMSSLDKGGLWQWNHSH